MKKATQQDTFDHIMLSGATGYEWYRRSKRNAAADAAYATGLGESDPDRVNGWEVVYEMGDPDQDSWALVTVSHKAILAACRKIISADRPKYVTDSAVHNARALLFDPDAVDFDANTADEVIQIIAYDSIVFG